jgi:hypothetical protein
MGDPEKSVQADISEVASQNPSALNSLYSTHNGSTLPVTEWPLEPHTLKESRLDSFLNMAFDAFLVNIPIWLMIKIGLVIYASKIDASKSGIAGSLFSAYTANLSRVNTQVGSN